MPPDSPVTRDNTGSPGNPGPGDHLAEVIGALDHPTRRRIVAILLGAETHVSQLARDLKVSRPVIHVHLARLQEAGLVSSSLRFSADGKSLRVFQLRPFDIRLTPEIIAATTEPEKGTGEWESECSV